VLTWLEPPQIVVPEALQNEVGGHPLVAQVLAQRGFSQVQAARAFLDPAAYTPAAALELPGILATIERLERAIQRGEQVCVWGDFDVDGQTATALLVSALRRLGAHVSHHIPVRAAESHGVNIPVLARLIDEGAQLVLTCDTGIAAHEAAEYAHQHGVDFLITDHHDLPLSPDSGETLLPQADAIVNPKLLPAGHVLGSLPGVGVAYKLAEELMSRAGHSSECAAFLDLVALGIVADIAVQAGDARYLLQRGLQALRANQRLGLQIMLELAELSPEYLTEEHIAYVLAPRLNALGRLGDANPAVELLTTDDPLRARLLAMELEGLNARRKLLTDQVFQAAQAQIEREPALLEGGALVLSHAQWPAGVIGIVASRLVEHYHKPVVLLSSPEGEAARGSARSVEGVNISAAIAENRELLIQFGGHPMAAGLSIDPERIPEFRRALGRSVQRMLGDRLPEATLQVDAYLSLADLSLDLVANLERLAPFGPGNPPLTLATRDLTLSAVAPVGRNDEHLLLTVEDPQGVAQKVVWWQGAGWALPEGVFDLAYSVRASTYRGRREVQVQWLEARLGQAVVAEIQSQPARLELDDYRREAHPLPILEQLTQRGDVLVWREGEARDRVEGVDRYGVLPCQTLAVWTIPPGPRELQAVLERARPQRVVVFAVQPGSDQPHAFLQRLVGLVKYALQANQGITTLQELAAATAQRTLTVRAGLDWLAARGHIRLLNQEGEELRLALGEGQSGGDLPQATERLKALLDETAAYRAHFSRAQADRLFALS